MTSRHFDVIVLGRSLGALITAALLARRDFAVLLVGHGQRAPSYAFERFTLKRRAFTLLFGASPVWRRILQDLAQSPTFRRRTHSVEPMFGMLTERRRLEVSARPDLFNQEIEREFPEVRQLVDEFYSRLASANALIDNAFNRDVVWPPETFWEKLEAARGPSLPQFAEAGEPDDLLGKFPLDHPYRELATLPAVFATHLDYGLMGLPALALARLHGSWSRGLYGLPGGEDELEEFLLERILAHGGSCRLDSQAEQVLVKNGRVHALALDSDEGPIGTDALVTSLSGEAVAELAKGQAISRKARFDWPTLTPTAGRFTVSIVMGNEGLPKPLAQETFLLPKESPYPNPRQPVVHLQRYPHVSRGQEGPKETLLVAEAIVPADGALSIPEARDAVLNTVRFHLPFLNKHVRVIDSPHDGLPLQDFRSGEERSVDRIHINQSSAKPEFMECQWTAEPAGFLGLAGEPTRGPIKGSYLVGKTVLPALGQEGELIAAWNVARILTRKDHVRQKRRRQLWTKIETG
jgi:hypothetical protein